MPTKLLSLSVKWWGNDKKKRCEAQYGVRGQALHGIMGFLLSSYFALSISQWNRFPSLCALAARIWSASLSPEARGLNWFHGSGYSKSARAAVTKFHRFVGLQKSISSQFRTSQKPRYGKFCSSGDLSPWLSDCAFFRCGFSSVYAYICVFIFPLCNNHMDIVLASTLIACFILH